MEFPIELLLTTLLTPILGAIATLFWLLNKEKDKRLEDRDRAIERLDHRIREMEKIISEYRDRVTPAMESNQRSISSLTTIIERFFREDRERQR